MRILTAILLIATVFITKAETLFYYAPQNGKGGLRLAVKDENGNWQEIGNEFNFVTSDFGPWGAGKKMWSPRLFEDGDSWKLIFPVTPSRSVYAVTSTSDFINWLPQDYYTPDSLQATLGFNPELNASSETVNLAGNSVEGRFVEVNQNILDNIYRYIEKKSDLAALYSERCSEDSVRFKDLENIKATLKISGELKDISPLLSGIFFEDINYAADGGLYAELIQNRDFEYSPDESNNPEWGPEFAWSIRGDGISFEILTDNPISANNPHYASLKLQSLAKGNSSSGLVNSGFDGISLKAGEGYRFRMKARSADKMPVEVSLLTPDGKVLATKTIEINPSAEWQDYETILLPVENYSGALLKISPQNPGVIDLDMISLFPLDTFNGHSNGLRKDLARTIADLKPRFIRFPGGCVAHGNGLDNIYDWKGSIGKLEDRKPLYNIWKYHQSRGLGYHEYFLFCEDIGAEPLPVIAAAVPCQNSGRPSHYTHDDLTLYGQQQGLPMDSLEAYIQDILDLIEYANGSVDSEWGSKRAQAGHPAPFNLKYIGIGNEDMITGVFKERFAIINDAVKKAHPEITVIGTVGPFYEGSDYDEGWRFAKEQNVDMVDEHYYVSPAWLIYNQDFYDDYPREGTKVYLGEWAAHLPDRSSTMETALAEALYITSLEKNADVVLMSSYAPLLAKKGHTQWRPDLIYFDNDSIYLTPDYHALRLHGQNSGDSFVNSTLDVDSENDKVKARVAASVVNDSSTGDTFIKLVNILPASVDMDIDLSGLSTVTRIPAQLDMTVMQGNYNETEPEFTNTIVKLDGTTLNISLPPYSFSIIRL